MKTLLRMALAILMVIQAYPPSAMGEEDQTLCSIIPENLHCENLLDPLGIDSRQPRLTWILQAVDPAARGLRQTAWQVLVASSPELLTKDQGDLWNSGQVASEESNQLVYSGAPLASGMACWWKVRVWDNKRAVSRWSNIGKWTMGLLNPTDWHARWIGSATGQNQLQQHNMDEPAPLFRKRFAVGKEVERATIYVSGLGYYELFLNGRQVGDHLLDPGFTRYDKRVQYVTYDVTSQIQEGENVIGAELGNGWYNYVAKQVWNFETAAWRDRPKLLAQLVLEYKDGSRALIATDGSWKTEPGPLVFNALYNGNVYDARLEQAGWDSHGFDDSPWKAASIVATPSGTLSAVMTPPVKKISEIVPVSVKEVKPGVFVFDLGQNIAGFARLKVTGSAGTRISIRYAEELNPDGAIDQGNVNQFNKSGDFQTDTYILKGGGEEDWRPQFVYDGFQYIEVSGFPGTPTAANVHGIVAHTDLPSMGSFSCSNELFNKIQKATRWSYLNNFEDHPTDCPQREKNGWTGDAQLACETGLYNFDPLANYEKWIRDFQDEQGRDGKLAAIIPTSGWGYDACGPAWDSAYLLIPWNAYLFRDDKRILADHYAGFTSYLTSLGQRADYQIVSFGLGDWVPSKTVTPAEVTSTAYYYRDSLVLSQIAGVLGKTEDEAEYLRQAGEIKEAFNQRFYHPDTHSYANGSQTALSCALYQGLAEADNSPGVVKQLVQAVHGAKDHLDCGILGTKYLLHALADNGQGELAYRVANQTTFPSWGNWIRQGATTLWEQWNGKDSRDHIMFGDISAWFYETLAGIRVQEPGFRKFIIAPQFFDELTWVSATHQSPYGEIMSKWERGPDKISLEIHVPVGAEATVYLPSGDVRESGRPLASDPEIKIVPSPADQVRFSVGSGVYHFVLPNGTRP
jgi:alpha-L-rhamnosidase